MATSRSTSGSASSWIAGACVFSGRPDSTWPIEPTIGETLLAIWELLPSTTAAAKPPALGYRGVFVRDPAGRTWTAYLELVTLAGETRRDEERRFERTVLSSAPSGTLPPFTAEE
jgi:hypothetical protein